MAPAAPVPPAAPEPIDVETDDEVTKIDDEGESEEEGVGTEELDITDLVDSQKNIEKGRSAFQNGIALCTILGFALFFLLVAAKPFLRFMNQPEDVVKLAIPFLDIVGFSLVPLVVFQAYKQFADGMSETKYSMFATIIGNVINIVINALLVLEVFHRKSFLIN